MSTRLHADTDVRAVLAARHRAHGRAMVVHARAQRADRPASADAVAEHAAADPMVPSARSTVVAGRKVGGAVTRNRAKRRLREALRAVDLPPGYDVVVVARAQARVEPFDALCAQLARQLQRATGPAASTSLDASTASWPESSAPAEGPESSAPAEGPRSEAGAA